MELEHQRGPEASPWNWSINMKYTLEHEHSTGVSAWNGAST